MRGGGRAHPPITLHDLDIYFSERSEVTAGGNDLQHIGITYNINHGVQIMGSVDSDAMMKTNLCFQSWSEWSRSASAVQHHPQGQRDEGPTASLPLPGEPRPASP